MGKDHQINIRLTSEKFEMLKRRMQESNFLSMSAYIRKMAIDGMVIKLDIPELKEVCSLLCYNGNNINQIAKRLNEGGKIYSEDIKDIKEKQNRICDMVNSINMKLSKI